MLTLGTPCAASDRSNQARESGLFHFWLPPEARHENLTRSRLTAYFGRSKAMSNVSKVFQQLISILDEAGVSPDRVGQVETEDGCTFEDDAPITYTDDGGATIVIYTSGEIFSDGEWVARMEEREDAWYQAQEMIQCAKEYAF
jgi:hypothetical protein